LASKVRKEAFSLKTVLGQSPATAAILAIDLKVDLQDVPYDQLESVLNKRNLVFTIR
jgi:hypothetical protein